MTTQALGVEYRASFMGLIQNLKYDDISAQRRAHLKSRFSTVYRFCESMGYRIPKHITEFYDALNKQ